jgi:hypothetical protein
MNPMITVYDDNDTDNDYENDCDDNCDNVYDDFDDVDAIAI